MLLRCGFTRRPQLRLDDGQFAARKRLVTGQHLIDSCRQVLHRKTRIAGRIGRAVPAVVDILSITRYHCDDESPVVLTLRILEGGVDDGSSVDFLARTGGLAAPRPYRPRDSGGRKAELTAMTRFFFTILLRVIGSEDSVFSAYDGTVGLSDRERHGNPRHQRRFDSPITDRSAARRLRSRRHPRPSTLLLHGRREGPGCRPPAPHRWPTRRHRRAAPRPGAWPAPREAARA